MLFDLRVLLAACLATLIFAAAGLGLIAGLRSPFKPSSGYTMKDGPLISGPGLPRGKQLPVAETNKPEITGTIQTHIIQTPAVPMPAVETAPKARKEIKHAPQAGTKNPSIATLIEEDNETRANPATTAPQAKQPPAKKKPRAHAKRAPKQPPRSNNPFSIFTTNNNTAPVR